MGKMFVKILVLIALIAYSQAGYVPVYPVHEANSYVKTINDYAAPVYAVPVDAGHGYGHGYGYQGGHGGDHYSYPKYKFAYGVNDPHTGDHKSQAEERDGDVVKGYYTVADPDGTLRTVHYTADDHSGFNAVVKKVGHAVHPVPVVKKVILEPVYEKPIYEYGHGHGYGGGVEYY